MPHVKTLLTVALLVLLPVAACGAAYEWHRADAIEVCEHTLEGSHDGCVAYVDGDLVGMR